VLTIPFSLTRWLGPGLLAWAIGVGLLQLQAVLPSPAVLGLAALLCAGLGLLLMRRVSGSPRVLWGATPLLLAAPLLLGAGWAAWRAEARLAQVLPVEWEGRDVLVVGTVLTLPQRGPRGERFEFRVEEVKTPRARVPPRILLNRYARPLQRADENADDDAVSPFAAVRPGERWQMTVRLRRPHGMSNPGGFDLEGWLLQRDLRATGYVRDRPRAVRVGEAGFELWLQVERLRFAIRERLEAALGEAPYKGVVIGLAIGDQSGIGDAEWRTFAATGTSHLMSISGLHVTMLAGLLGGLAAALWRWVPGLCLRVPARRAGMAVGVLAATAYTLLAGYGIPAQRTLYMLAVGVLALWSGRTVSVRRVLLLALVVVLLADPWAVLAAGFWLSFAAVGVLLYAASAAGDATTGWRRRLLEWGHAQWAVTIGSVPLLLWLFQQVSLVSPLANAVAIPLVSAIVGPLSVAAALLPVEALARLPAWVLGPLMSGLEWMAAQPWSLWQQAQPPWWAVGLGCLGVVLLLLPRGIPGRLAGAALLLPALWPALPPLSAGEASVDVLDVGHGLSALVRTGEHALLFDTGPRYGPESDAGQRVVVPALRALGVASLDALMLSHEDSDHAGGVAAVLREVPVAWWTTSLADVHPLRAGGPPHRPCVAGMRWDWDGVAFEVLHPPAAAYDEHRKSNHMSCVLRVRARSATFLLTGDIEKQEEAWLLAATPGLLPAEVLQVPHHGSRSSSTPGFIDAVAPQHTIIPVGHRNRYRHPHPEVLARYRDAGVRVWRTDTDGALRVRLAEPLQVEGQRARAPRYWQDGGLGGGQDPWRKRRPETPLAE